MAKLTVSTGAKLTGYGARAILSGHSDREEKWNLFLEGRAKELSKNLGELKGSLMKAGQMLSMYGEHFLPPEANEFLKSLQSNSAPLNWEAIEQVLSTSLSPQQLAQLTIEREPIGSASLGQVHKAVIDRTGEEIALKIQYPGVKEAIDSDLKALRSFLSVFRLLPKNFNPDPVFAEIREMLRQETDYENEIQQTKLYAEKLKNDARYIVPKIYDDFCGPNVIASSFERGLSADDPLIQALSQSRRNQLAFNFIDLYLRELFDWGVVQTDPHLGNYRVRLNSGGHDQLVLFDFGAVRTYPAGFILPYRRMVRASLHKNYSELSKEALELKFVYPDDPPALVQLFEKFCLEMCEPFADAEFDWKKSSLPKRLTQQVFNIIQKFHLRPPPREIIFLNRKTGGVFIFCSVLGAKINTRALITSYCENL